MKKTSIYPKEEKALRQKNRYGNSAKATHSIKGPLLRGGSLGFMRVAAVIIPISITNPITLIVHGKPTFGSNCCAIAGKTNPPVAEPLAHNPSASDRFLKK